MSYPEQVSNPKILQNVLFKKEFAQLKLNPSLDPEPHNPNFLDNEIYSSGKLQLHTYQKFVSAWMSPNTPYLRLLIKWETGTGKTVNVLSMAMAFIEYFSRMFRTIELTGKGIAPSIFVIGFSKQIFYREILRRPEFGFITREEIATERRLRSLASQTGSKADRDVLTDYHSMLKKRLSKRTRHGFFKFYGYKEFFNRLIIFSDEGIARIVEDLKLETTDKSKLEESHIIYGLSKKYILLNLDLIDQLANSLLICDEIQNVYNSSEINNYGMSIRLALMIHDDPVRMMKLFDIGGETSFGVSRMEWLKQSVVRAVYMTATPINNSPTEIIDLLNLVLPIKNIIEFQSGDKTRLYKEDFFIDNRNLKPGALEMIENLIRGYVSFLSDRNPVYFPSFSISGTQVKIPKSMYHILTDGFKDTHIPYLKFIECPMSKLHYKTYEKIYSGTLPPDGQTLLDMILPNPTNNNEGLFRTHEIKSALTTAPQEWKDKYQINIIRQSNLGWLIVGDFMKLPTLSLYSTKYYMMVKHVIQNLKEDGGKIIINHQHVKMSGVLMISEILKKNGIIGETDTPSSDTLCSKCGYSMHHHTTFRGHDFIPARFILIHGEIDQSSRENSMEKFKSIDNIDGYGIRILVGSPTINEGMDFNEIRNLWIMNVPTNIPTLIQIIGRGVRKSSHLRLPPEKRHVDVKIFVSSVPKSNNKSYELSYELKRYLEKTQDYIVIQKLEKILNKNAIDSPINIDINTRSIKDEQYQLGMMPYEFSSSFGKKWSSIVRGEDSLELKDVDVSTFNMFHIDDEISTIKYIIKRLFIEQSQVWTYDDLWHMTKNPPFEVFQNLNMLSEENFVIALESMTGLGKIDVYISSTHPIDRLFDPSDLILVKDGVECKITFIDGMYIMMPIRSRTIPDVSISDEKRLQVQLGVNSNDVVGIPDIDIENWYRYAESVKNNVIPITSFLQTTSVSYDQLKLNFYKTYRKSAISEFPTSMETYGIDFHIRLVQDSIKYCFNILTNSTMPFSELHDFYFKLLYFYDKFDLILFANNVDPESQLYEKYKPYISVDTTMKYGIHAPIDNIGDKKYLINDNKYNSFLMSSILKTANMTKPFQINRMNDFLGKTHKSHKAKTHIKLEDVIDRFDITKNVKINKVFSNILPVGHFISNNQEQIAVPMMFDPTVKKDQPAWFKSTDFLKPSEITEVENDIIIGYYEQNPAGLELKFKIRAPVHKSIQYEDTRMQERGSTCNTHKKEKLFELAKKLDIKNPNQNIRSICLQIKLELMRREMIERRKARANLKKKGTFKKIRWFYLHFEG